MKALITGASSGIGEAISRELSCRGYHVILIARREDLLLNVKNSLSGPCEIFSCDITLGDNAFRIFQKYPDIDLLVNCAGCGVFGEFTKTDIQRELDMISLNVASLHVLTKLYFKSFCQRNSGKILNVASSAAFFSGPFFSSYYASKAYVLHLSEALSYECKGSGVCVSVFCPGPVKTEFGKKDGISDGRGAISPERAALAAINGVMKGKRIIFPDLKTQLLVFFSRFLPREILLKIVKKEQMKKMKGKDL